MFNMLHRIILCLSFVVSGPLFASPRMTIADLLAQGSCDRYYEIEGDIVCRADWLFLIRDATGAMFVNDMGMSAPKPGSHVIATVVLARPDPKNRIYAREAIFSKAEIFGWNEGVTTPIAITPADMSRIDELKYRLVTIRGTVTDIFHDEIDPRWVFLFIEENGIRAIVPIQSYRNKDFPSDETLIDAEVEITGVFAARPANTPPKPGRHNFGPHVIDYNGTGVKITKPSPANPFTGCPEVDFDTLHGACPDHCTHRCRTRGCIIATFGQSSALLAVPNGQRLRVKFHDNVRPPDINTTIDVAAFIRNGLFFTTLANAVWSEVHGVPEAKPDPPEQVSAYSLLFDSHGQRKINHLYDGRIIRLTGRVTDTFRLSNGKQRLVLNSDGITVNAEAPDMPLPDVGSVIEATGACLISETSELTADFIRLDGFSLILRTPADLRIISRPPWWTPGRLLIVVLSLSGIILGILVWNTLLRRLVNRRSHELMRETLAHERANLRVDERMRLAVELHDSIVQNMTGVSMQFDAVEQALNENSPMLPKLITKTRRTLDACCRELRDCLWDLRNNSLEDTDVGVAVRKALEPHLESTTADITLPLPRAKIPDATFHAILSIIRELSVNAIRHGGASNLVIRGGRTDDTIRFSVEDNGCGFDPDVRQGANEGHFGLLGVEERLARLGGKMTIDSAPGKGTRVDIEIEL